MKKLLTIMVIVMMTLLTSCVALDPVDPIPDPNTDPDKLPKGMLFEHGITGEDKFYNYCPTIFEEDGTRHIYYCSNKRQGNVTDYIFYRSATKNEFGTWVYSDYEIVLEPTEDTWDSRHTCDPTVIKGEFKYNEEDYNYMMAYLGCVTSDNQFNEVGIAVAKTPRGPWVKVNDLNPICHYEKNDDPSKFQWGYGQPSLVSVDKKGTVLLFFTEGNGVSTHTNMRKYDFSNLNDIKLIDEKVLTVKGIKNANGGQDNLNNADFAYDSVNDRIYVVQDGHPYDSEYPNFIASFNGVYYFNNNNKEEVGYGLFNPQGASWTHVVKIDKSQTTFDRNHNMGIVTDAYGWLLNSEEIEVVYTGSSIAESFWGAHATYRLYTFKYSIKDI